MYFKAIRISMRPIRYDTSDIIGEKNRKMKEIIIKIEPRPPIYLTL
jgi:hypothetical protein